LNRNLSHQQLSMFETAGNLSKLPLGDTRKGESNSDVLARKLAAAKKDGLYESIKEHGVQQPVNIVHGLRPKTGEPYSDLHEGHHRVASAAHINPNMLVPVKNVEPHETLDW
jgi:hypothetical protein